MSSTDMETPYQLNNLFNRTAVDVNPGEYYDDCRGSLLVVLCSHIIAVILPWPRLIPQHSQET